MMMVRILRIDENNRSTILNDEVVEDVLIDFYIDEHFADQFHCIPKNLEELALGNLIYRGIRPLSWKFEHFEKIVRINIESHQNIEDEPVPFTFKVKPTIIIQSMEDLLNDPLHKRTGAVHIAGLYTKDGSRIVRFEDVGRHNAVDKVIGWMLKNRISPEGKILLSSGRLPLEMAVKCVRAGIEILVSKAPVLLSAIDFSHRYNLTLIGFVREKRMNVYTHPERLEGGV